VKNAYPFQPPRFLLISRYFLLAQSRQHASLINGSNHKKSAVYRDVAVLIGTMSFDVNFDRVTMTLGLLGVTTASVLFMLRNKTSEAIKAISIRLWNTGRNAASDR